MIRLKNRKWEIIQVILELRIMILSEWQVLMQGVFARFKEQNAQLRAYLSELEPSGAVNAAAFKSLDRFDDELSGVSHESQGTFPYPGRHGRV